MSILLLDPTGEVALTKPQDEKVLEVLTGKRVGYIFNQHGSAQDFWKALEEGVARKFRPSAVQRVYKENTWAPASIAEVDKLAQETDYALIGVGA